MKHVCSIRVFQTKTRTTGSDARVWFTIRSTQVGTVVFQFRVANSLLQFIEGVRPASHGPDEGSVNNMSYIRLGCGRAIPLVMQIDKYIPN